MKWSKWDTQGPGGHWFMKKIWCRKSRVRLLLTVSFLVFEHNLPFGILFNLFNSSLKPKLSVPNIDWLNIISVIYSRSRKSYLVFNYNTSGFCFKFGERKIILYTPLLYLWGWTVSTLRMRSVRQAYYLIKIIVGIFFPCNL